MISLVFLIVFSGLPVYEIDEIVVTATRYPTALSDVALATVVIDHDEIERLHPISLTEILRQKTGIDVKDYGTPGSVSSASLRGVQSNGVLILLNGHPLNAITTGIADLSLLNSNTVERVEIIKGPASSIYGANALGGVINIITTKKFEKPTLHLTINPSTTDFNKPLQNKEFFMHFGVPLRKITMGISGGYTSSDGYRSNSDMTRHHLETTLGYTHGNLDMHSTITYDDKECGVPGPVPLVDSIHSVPRFGDSTVTSLFDRQEDKIILGDIAINWHITENLKLHNTIFADRKQMHFHTTYAGWLGDTITEDFDYLTHTFGVNTMTVLDIDNTKIVFGIDGHYDTLGTAKNSEETGDTVWNASSYNVGAWLECKRTFNTLTFIPSIRFDKNSRFGNFFSPQLGIVGAFVPNLLIKVSFGKAFRAPSFNDLYWPIYGNPDLKPEHGWAYEARFEGSPLPNIFAALSLYMRNIKDRISWLPGQDGMWQPQNVNSMDIKGMDIELRSQINDAITLYLEGTYLNARQKNNEIVYDYYDWVADTNLTITEEIERRAAFTPTYVLSSRININLPYQLCIDLAGSYVSDRVNYYADYGNYPYVSMATKILNTYFTVDAVLSTKFFNVITLAVGAKNIFDVTYATQFGNTRDDFDYPMPGQTLFARIVVDY